MSENKTTVQVFGWNVKLWIIYGILAYFVYNHSVDGVLGILLLSFVVGLVMIISMIPIIGWIAALLLNWYYVIPKLLIFTSLDMTWLVQTIFVLNGIIGLIITGTMTLAAIVTLTR
jgi:hypothetical protein